MRLMGKRPASISGVDAFDHDALASIGGFLHSSDRLSGRPGARRRTRPHAGGFGARVSDTELYEQRNRNSARAIQGPEVAADGRLGPGSVLRQDAWLFRRAQAHEPIDGVRGALRGGMVMPNLQLAQQAKASSCVPARIITAGNDEQRPVLIHHVLMGDDLEHQQKHRQQRRRQKFPARQISPKKCSGRVMYFSRKRMVIRSKKTRKVRPMP